MVRRGSRTSGSFTRGRRDRHESPRKEDADADNWDCSPSGSPDARARKGVRLTVPDIPRDREASDVFVNTKRSSRRWSQAPPRLEEHLLLEKQPEYQQSASGSFLVADSPSADSGASFRMNQQTRAYKALGAGVVSVVLGGNEETSTDLSVDALELNEEEAHADDDADAKLLRVLSKDPQTRTEEDLSVVQVSSAAPRLHTARSDHSSRGLDVPI